MKTKQTMKLYRVIFSHYYRHRWRGRRGVLIFADDIDSAKLEARRMRPDCNKLQIREVTKIGR